MHVFNSCNRSLPRGTCHPLTPRSHTCMHHHLAVLGREPCDLRMRNGANAAPRASSCSSAAVGTCDRGSGAPGVYCNMLPNEGVDQKLQCVPLHFPP